MTDIIVKDIKNGSEYYYGGSADVSAEDVSYDNSSSGAVANNLQDAMDEVFQSVSNGKGLIADAITDKGVQTSATDSFQTMANNIESLSVWGKYTSNSQWDVLFFADNIHHSYDYDLYWKVTDVHVENWDNVYYGVFYYRYNKESLYTYVKYNQTKNKIYSYNWSYTHGVNSYSFSIYYDNDNDRTRLSVYDWRLIWYFDSTNNFTLTDTWAWTLTLAPWQIYSDAGWTSWSYKAYMGEKAVLVRYKHSNVTHQYAAISVSQRKLF